MEIGNPGREGVGRPKSMINEEKLNYKYVYYILELQLLLLLSSFSSSKLVHLDAVLNGRAAFLLL